MIETETWQNHWIEILTFVVTSAGFTVLLLQLRDVGKTIGIQNGQLKAQDAQLKAQNEQLKAQTLSSLYGHYFYFCRALLEKPYLRAYLYDGMALGAEPEDQHRRAEVLTLCEFLTGLLEQAEVQQRNLPGDNWFNCWEPLMRDMYRHREAEMAKFYHTHSRWYCVDFRNRVDGFLRLGNGGID
jgi:hypothetical protein